MTKKSKGASLETWNYSYDQHNHLVTVEKHATDGGTLQLKVQYKYDALGNRIERTEDSNGDGNVDVTQRFGYDGANVWADLDGSNGLTYRRLFGPGVDDPVARITAAGTVVWYLLDYQNSVIGMVDSTGTSLGSITYDGFGNVLTNTTGVNGDRYGFTSREWDSSVSLQYNRARYYDPNLGKWTSADPIGFEAGDANLYRYVANQADNRVDPSGTETLAASGHINHHRPAKPGGTISIGGFIGGAIGSFQLGFGLLLNLDTHRDMSVTATGAAPTNGGGVGFGVGPVLQITDAEHVLDLNGKGTATGGDVGPLPGGVGVGGDVVSGSGYHGVAGGILFGPPGGGFHHGETNTKPIASWHVPPDTTRPAIRGGSMCGPSCK